jgi:hypothetical protein
MDNKRLAIYLHMFVVYTVFFTIVDLYVCGCGFTRPRVTPIKKRRREELIGRRFNKYFPGHGTFEGTIVNRCVRNHKKCFHVIYGDDDSEDLSESEVEVILIAML